MSGISYRGLHHSKLMQTEKGREQLGRAVDKYEALLGDAINRPVSFGADTIFVMAHFLGVIRDFIIIVQANNSKYRLFQDRSSLYEHFQHYFQKHNKLPSSSILTKDDISNVKDGFEEWYVVRKPIFSEELRLETFDFDDFVLLRANSPIKDIIEKRPGNYIKLNQDFLRYLIRVRTSVFQNLKEVVTLHQRDKPAKKKKPAQKKKPAKKKKLAKKKSAKKKKPAKKATKKKPAKKKPAKKKPAKKPTKKPAKKATKKPAKKPAKKSTKK